MYYSYQPSFLLYSSLSHRYYPLFSPSNSSSPLYKHPLRSVSPHSFPIDFRPTCKSLAQLPASLPTPTHTTTSHTILDSHSNQYSSQTYQFLSYPLVISITSLSIILLPFSHILPWHPLASSPHVSTPTNLLASANPLSSPSLSIPL